MLPATPDSGERLAAVLPTALNAVLNRQRSGVRAVVVVVVDGLGWMNLQDRRGHARTLTECAGEAIHTVVPSTTGAALSTITTGALPGEHGLVGYRIRHPRLGLVVTLSEWDGIPDVRSWQRSETVFERARRSGVRPVVTGRSQHRFGGLTRAILTGADYLGADTIDERVDRAIETVRQSNPSVVYVYVDELDRAGHRDGWRSNAWTRRLEELDAAFQRLLTSVPSDVGVLVTADHGMVDVPHERQVLLRELASLQTGIAAIGGEPRFRYLYLEQPDQASKIAERIRDEEGHRAWVFERDEAVASGMFGRMDEDVSQRVGEVILAARDEVAYYIGYDGEVGRRMIGQHGSLSERERTVPLIQAGAFGFSDVFAN